MESWRDKLRREAREIHDAVVAALAIADDRELRTALELLVSRPHFTAMTWLWAPAVAQRDRVMFRPFILSSFSRESMDKDGKPLDPWKGETGAALQRWLDEVDAADDIELTKRLYGWKLDHTRDRETVWRAELVKRLSAAATPATRHTALAKIDHRDLTLDAATALALWKVDRKVAKPFILGHIPWRHEMAEWAPVLAATREDPQFHFELYRKIVDEAHWRSDVLALPATPDIAAQLQQRHPAIYWIPGAGEVFHRLLEKHGAAAIPYVMRHADKVQGRGWGPKQVGKGLQDLLDLAVARGWFALWGTLLRTSAPAEMFDKEVGKLVDAGARSRLELLPGRGREFHMPGASWAFVHTLTDDTASRLYAKYPALVRGPYRLHVAPSYNIGFAKLAGLAIAAGDEDLVEYLASRLALLHGNAHHAAAIALLTAHYEQLPEAVFVRRAASALSRIPAFGVWSFDALLANNALARLLFKFGTTRYLTDSAAVRDLLESPQIHVQLLAFRILAQRDPRAPAIAAEHVDLLQATLLRKLRRPTRLLAFAALANAARHDEAVAKTLLHKMRDALALPEKRYPTEQLVGLIGTVLHAWPALRSAREQPVVYAS